MTSGLEINMIAAFSSAALSLSPSAAELSIACDASRTQAFDMEMADTMRAARELRTGDATYIRRFAQAIAGSDAGRTVRPQLICADQGNTREWYAPAVSEDAHGQNVRPPELC